MIVIINFLLAWGIIIYFLWTIYRNLNSGFIHLKRLHQVPCHKCKYFTKSYYLKCTINPQTACSEAAIDCRDYQPQ